MLITAVGRKLLESSMDRGWVLEPDAKKLLADAGLAVPRFVFATSKEAALRAAREIGYPLVAKIVSPAALHKSDVGGVVVGLETDDVLGDVFDRFSRIEGFLGVHLEETVKGVELIIGAKIDFQFGPVVLLGIGGTGVELYQDTAIRMAPLTPKDIASMVDSLKARKLLTGYRGAPPVNLENLTQTLMRFSTLVLEISDRIESIDLNPVICTADACVVADARMMTAKSIPNRN